MVVPSSGFEKKINVHGIVRKNKTRSTALDDPRIQKCMNIHMNKFHVAPRSPEL